MWSTSRASGSSPPCARTAPPNLSPKGTTIVWDDEHLAFLHVCSPGTVANLLENPAVEINVVDPIVRKGYRFKGTGEVLTEGRSTTRCSTGSSASGGPTSPGEAVVLVQVDTAAPVISPAYDTGASEPDIIERWREHHSGLHGG